MYSQNIFLIIINHTNGMNDQYILSMTHDNSSPLFGDIQDI